MASNLASDCATNDGAPDIVWKLTDLHKQATVERSHYYVASVVREATVEIERLRRVELAAGNLDRYSLVIESAVRNEDPNNSDGVTGAILRLRSVMKRQITALATRTSEPQIDHPAQAAIDALEAAFRAGFHAARGGKVNPLTAWTRWITRTEPTV